MSVCAWLELMREKRGSVGVLKGAVAGGRSHSVISKRQERNKKSRKRMRNHDQESGGAFVGNNALHLGSIRNNKSTRMRRCQ